jgi:hypothetical protein
MERRQHVVAQPSDSNDAVVDGHIQSDRRNAGAVTYQQHRSFIIEETLIERFKGN